MEKYIIGIVIGAAAYHFYNTMNNKAGAGATPAPAPQPVYPRIPQLPEEIPVPITTEELAVAGLKRNYIPL